MHPSLPVAIPAPFLRRTLHGHYRQALWRFANNYGASLIECPLGRPPQLAILYFPEPHDPAAAVPKYNIEAPKGGDTCEVRDQEELSDLLAQIEALPSP